MEFSFASEERGKSHLLTNESIQKAIDCGILTLANVESLVNQEMIRREKILSDHNHEIWQSKDKKYWYTYVDDATKPAGRRLVKRTSRMDIENYICAEKLEKSPEHSKTSILHGEKSMTIGNQKKVIERVIKKVIKVIR